MGRFSVDRWAIVTSIASGLTSITVLLLFALKLITGNAFTFLNTLQPEYLSMGIAGVNLVVSLYLAPFAFKSHPKIGGMLSLATYISLSVSLGLQHPELFFIFFSFWLAAILAAGLYSRIAALLFGAASAGFIIFGSAGGYETFDSVKFLAALVSILASIISIVFWEDVKSDKQGAKPTVSSNASQTLEVETIIDSIGDGVAIINNEGIIEVFNPAAVAITGWSETEALGLDHRSVFLFFTEKEVAYEEDQSPIVQALKTQSAVVDNSCLLETRTKKKLDIDFIASPIKTDKGLVGSVVIFRDVSKARSEERQRAEFISTASHEMRTPVASIEGYLALALNEKVSKIDTAARSYLEKAHSSTQHLGKLFQDLLTAAKSEDGRLTNHPTVVEVGELLDEMIQEMRFSAEKHHLYMKADFGGGEINPENNASEAPAIRPVAYVHVDPDRLREVVTNLFDNAIKYTEKGGVSIGMRTSEEEVHISVTDTGIGISQEDLPHLFQKFYRIDNSDTRQVGGTGLGLFISKKILDLYKGRLSAESELGKGTTFTISLPRLSAEQARITKQVEANQINPVSKEAPVKAVIETVPVAEVAEPTPPAPAPISPQAQPAPQDPQPTTKTDTA